MRILLDECVPRKAENRLSAISFRLKQEPTATAKQKPTAPAATLTLTSEQRAGGAPRPQRVLNDNTNINDNTNTKINGNTNRSCVAS